MGIQIIEVDSKKQQNQSDISSLIKIQTKILVEQQCPKNHDLQYVSYTLINQFNKENVISCIKCEKKFGDIQCGTFRCKQCDYDICEKCFSYQDIPNQNYCQKGHQMIIIDCSLIKNQIKLQNCDICKLKITHKDTPSDNSQNTNSGFFNNQALNSQKQLIYYLRCFQCNYDLCQVCTKIYYPKTAEQYENQGETNKIAQNKIHPQQLIQEKKEENTNMSSDLLQKLQPQQKKTDENNVLTQTTQKPQEQNVLTQLAQKSTTQTIPPAPQTTQNQLQQNAQKPDNQNVLTQLAQKSIQNNQQKQQQQQKQQPDQLLQSLNISQQPKNQQQQQQSNSLSTSQQLTQNSNNSNNLLSQLKPQKTQQNQLLKALEPQTKQNSTKDILQKLQPTQNQSQNQYQQNNYQKPIQQQQQLQYQQPLQNTQQQPQQQKPQQQQYQQPYQQNIDKNPQNPLTALQPSTQNQQQRQYQQQQQNSNYNQTNQKKKGPSLDVLNDLNQSTRKKVQTENNYQPIQQQTIQQQQYQQSYSNNQVYKQPQQQQYQYQQPQQTAQIPQQNFNLLAQQPQQPQKQQQYQVTPQQQQQFYQQQRAGGPLYYNTRQ